VFWNSNSVALFIRPQFKQFDMKRNNGNTGITTENDHAVPEVKSVFINNDSIHYIDVGKGDPVVFVHGGIGDYRTWGAQMDSFTKNYRVIAYSRRFAFPNKQIINDSADYSVTPHSKDLAEFIKALNLEPVHLVGHSYGAFTALLTTMAHPELVRSLTLGEPPVMPLLENVPGGDTMLNNFIKAAIAADEAFKNNEEEKAVSIFISGVMDDSLYFSRLPQKDREIMMANTLELKGILSTPNWFPQVTCDDLKKIKIPVLLVQGDKSPLFLTSIISELNRCLNNREIATLKNTTHGLEYENPAEFNKAVLAFIDKY
jgi:pimeloyl-ACP methyl ester carboxylesterase